LVHSTSVEVGVTKGHVALALLKQIWIIDDPSTVCSYPGHVWFVRRATTRNNNRHDRNESFPYQKSARECCSEVTHQADDSDYFIHAEIKEKSSNKSANNSKRNVEPKALALPIDDLAADETGDQPRTIQTADDPIVCVLLKELSCQQLKVATCHKRAWVPYPNRQ
jgi:hypothetical protein